MGIKVLLQRTIAGVLYLGGILFATYIVMIILKGNVSFNASALIICIMGVCIPIAIATFLFVSSMQEVEQRFRIINVSIFFVFIFYIILLINILFLNGYRRFVAVHTVSMADYFKWNVNYIPFTSIGKYVRAIFNHSMNRSIIVENLLGNLLLFAPLGILLPCIFQRLRNFRKILTVMLAVLVSVEVAQFLTHTGSCDIDDIILNLIGAIIFYGLWNINMIQKILRKAYVLK
jgi:Glycopeptide antibiotics resistance protein